MAEITTVTVSGGFHNSSPITLRLRAGAMSVGQYKRLTNHMCGIKGCICGMRHGWEVNGISLADLAEATQNAAYEATRR